MEHGVSGIFRDYPVLYFYPFIMHTVEAQLLIQSNKQLGGDIGAWIRLNIPGLFSPVLLFIYNA